MLSILVDYVNRASNRKSEPEAALNTSFANQSLLIIGIIKHVLNSAILHFLRAHSLRITAYFALIHLLIGVISYKSRNLCCPLFFCELCDL